jgi:hypothetical protein
VANEDSPSSETIDPRDPGTLPPLGEGTDPDNWSKVNQFIDKHAVKAVNFYQAPCDQADTNLIVYEKGKSTAVNATDVISNKIRKDIVSLMSDLLREPVTRTILPEENGEPPVMVPLLQPIQSIDPTSGLPVLQAEFPVDDGVEADFENVLVDYFWEKADLDSDIESLTFNARIAGWYIAPFEEDRQKMLPRLRTNISVRQVLLDPSVGPIRAVENANWGILRWRINYWQARAMYPHLSKYLDEKASTGPGYEDPVLKLGTTEENQQTGEKMVDLSFFWMRNYPAQKMTPQEAVEWGEVEAREIQDAAATIPPAGANDDQGYSRGGEDLHGASGSGLLEEGEAETQAAATAPVGSRDVFGNTEVNDDSATTDDRGELEAGAVGQRPEAAVDGVSQGGLAQATNQGFAGGMAAPVVATRLAYFLPESDTEINESSPEWPWWLATRQITRVNRCVADDRASTFYDGIPFVHMTANPVPHSACGQGDPETMQHSQEGRNRALTNAVAHSDLMAHPIKVFSASAWAALPARYKEEGASIAGMSVIIDDKIYEKLGGTIQVTQPGEPISAALTQILDILGREHEDMTPSPSAAQGKAQADGATGWQTNQMRQQQAAGRLDLPAKFLEKAVRRLMNLVRWWALWRVPIGKIQQICSHLPPEVVEYLVMRGRESDRNIKVTANLSSGGVQARKQSEAVQKHQLGLISKETLSERMNEDFKKEQPKILQEMATMPQPVGPDGQPQQSGPQAA